MSEIGQRGANARFEVMDGLRGIAALAVVLFHTWKGHPLIENGQLAVDLFFLLSGFVIGYSYDEKLRTGMSWVDFAAKRWIRLYPMVFLGAVGGIAIALIHNRTNPGDAYPLGAIATSGGLSLLVLPYLGHAISDRVFSFEVPLWSLFFELLANFVYALFARRLNNWVLVLIVIAGVAGVAIGGPIGGGAKTTFWLGFPRVACGFFGGVLLYRLWRDQKLPHLRAGFVSLSAVLALIFMVPTLIGGWAFLPVYAVFMLVILAAANAAPARTDGLCNWLGEVSYPVYAIHWLTLYVFAFAGTKLHLPYNATGCFHLLCAPLIAYAVFRFYDAPVRKWLGDRWALWKRRAAPALAAA